MASASMPMEGMEGKDAKAGMEGMEGMDHAAMGHDHMMTPEQMTELREKIPLYKVYTDEQIMENMGRMPPDFWGMLSSPDMQGNIGVLALGHGYTEGGNEQFENFVRPISKIHPTAMAPGMAMMSGSHIQKAVDELTSKHGVKTIVVVPTEPGDDTSLIHQWQYIFGLRDTAPYLTVDRVKTDAKIIFTKSPAADPHVATILRDHALEVSANPAKDRLIIVSHGPEKPEDNPAELALLQKHADAIVASSKFKDVKVVSVEDDAIPEIRAARIADLRRYTKEAIDDGREVVIVPMILTKGGFHKRLQKDLAGLDFKFANRGLIEHPAFQEWLSDAVSKASGS
jgi:sirohydrochlorin ferrochelatase